MCLYGPSTSQKTAFLPDLQNHQKCFCYFSRNEISLKITCIYNLHLSYKLSKFDWVIHITTFFHGNIAQLHQFTHLLWVYIPVEKQINLRRNGIFLEQSCTLTLTFWWFWYITKIDMVYFHYKSHWYLYSARVLFFSFHTTWRHSNKVVKQAVPLIATHINDKAFIMITKK